MIAQARADLKYGARVLAKSPGFTLTALACVALGIGLNTTMFTLLQATILQSVPGVDGPEELAALEGRNSIQEYELYRDQNTAFSGVTAFMSTVPFNIADGGRAERIWGQAATGNYFSVLKVKPSIGRLFLPEDDRPAAAPVIVLSHRYWQSRFNGDPAIIGRVLQVNRRGCPVIGVAAAESFLGASPLLTPADVWVPAGSRAQLMSTLERGVDFTRMGFRPADDASLAFTIEGRLKPGVSLAAAQASLDTIAARFDRNQPRKGEEKRRAVMRLLQADKMVPIRPEDKVMVTLIPAGLTGLVLLIACANVANMLLARAAVRQREIGIRLAVGADRSRLVRQLLTENLLLSATGGAIGLIAAFVCARLISSVKVPLPFRPAFDLSPDPRVLAFAVALSLATGIIFGLAPALQATRVDLTGSLKERASTGIQSRRLFGLRNLLVLSQISGSLLLLLVTGFMALSYQHLNQVDLGFEPQGVHMLSVDPVRDGYSPGDVGRLFERLIERAGRIPGVMSASITDTIPLNMLSAGEPMQFTIDRDPAIRPALRYTVTAGYFETLRLPIVQGRGFNTHDADVSPLPVVVNEKAARTLWPDEDPIGKVLRSGARPCQVVGIAKDGSFGMLLQVSTTYVYQPMLRRPEGRSTVSGTTLLVRAGRGADNVGFALRRAVEDEDSKLTIFNAQSMSEHVDAIFFRLRLGMWIYAGLGLVGLLIAAVGIYGLTSYAAAHRRHEIGIRMALGAKRSSILKLVLRDALIVLAVGLLLGESAGFAVAWVLASFVQQLTLVTGSSVSDLTVVLGVPLLLAIVELAASYWPARRAATLDPLEALRHE